MMDEQDYYLTKIEEECAEVIQRISKLRQFGPKEVEPGQLNTNIQRVHMEVLDLEATIGLAREALCLPFRPPNFIDLVEQRRRKMKKYRDLSVQLGRLAP